MIVKGRQHAHAGLFEVADVFNVQAADIERGSEVRAAARKISDSLAATWRLSCFLQVGLEKIEDSQNDCKVANLASENLRGPAKRWHDRGERGGVHDAVMWARSVAGR